MDRKLHTDNLEQLLKEKSDEFRMYPSKKVWHSIYNDLHPGRKWPSVAVSMLLVIALLLIGYLNTTNNSTGNNIAGVSKSTEGGIKNKSGNSKENDPADLNGSSRQQALSQIPIQQPVAISNTFDNNHTPAANDITADKISSANNSVPLNGTYSNENGSTEGSAVNNTARARNPVITKPDNLVDAVDYYIRSNQLLADVAGLHQKKVPQSVIPSSTEAANNEFNKVAIRDLNNAEFSNPEIINKPVTNSLVKADNNTNIKSPSTTNTNTLTAEEKAWMEDYALHNKPGRNKWKDRVTMEIYATPDIGYRKLNSNISSGSLSQVAVDKTIDQKPAMGMEAGLGLTYHLGKNILLKGGAQLNYTNYIIKADQTNHPILTSLLMNDPNTGNTYFASRTSTFSNSSGLQPVALHNKTYQFSLPVGVAIKLAGDDKKLSWFVGASIQPTLVFGGTANLISADYKNYIADKTVLRRLNMNSSFETYITYPIGGYTLQVGPRFRYQMFSTFDKKYTFNENLYSTGLKIGLVKGF